MLLAAFFVCTVSEQFADNMQTQMQRTHYRVLGENCANLSA